MGETLDAGMKKILVLTATVKISVLLLILLASRHFTFQDQNYLSNFHYPAGEPIGIWTLFKTWDAQHYLYLADQGYKPNQISNAYFPLLPWLIGYTKPLLGESGLVAGLLLSNAFALLAMVFLYRLIRDLFDERTAWGTCLLLLSFPMAFFSGLVYTESLFLFLTTVFFYCQTKGIWKGAASAAFFLPLTRPTGLLIFIPIVVELFLNKKKPKNTVLVLLFAVMGGGFYFLTLQSLTGDGLGGFGAQKSFGTGHLAVFDMNPFQWVSKNFIHLHYTLDDLKTSFVDRAAFLGFLAVIPFAWRNFSVALFAYLLAIGISGAVSVDLASYARYLSALFPFFVLLAIPIKEKAWLLALGCFPLQAYFVVRHALNYWVS